MASSPSPSSLDSVGTSPLGSFSDPNEHPLLARDLGLGPLVGYGDSGVFNGINSSTFSSCSSSMLHNSALSLYLNGLGSGNNLDSGSTLKVCTFLLSSECCNSSTLNGLVVVTVESFDSAKIDDYKENFCFQDCVNVENVEHKSVNTMDWQITVVTFPFLCRTI